MCHKYLVLFGVLIILLVTEVFSETTIKSEENIIQKNFKDLGSREYLSNNLIGINNLANAYLPNNINVVNIIEAYREVIDGVRYEILVNTRDDLNEEHICRLVINEKPWLITIWNEKFRELIYSNCSTNNYVDEFNIVESNYKPNTLFENHNKELTNDQLLELEKHIIETNGDQDNSFKQTNEPTKIEPQTTDLNVSSVENTYLSDNSTFFLDNFSTYYNFGSSNENITIFPEQADVNVESKDDSLDSTYQQAYISEQQKENNFRSKRSINDDLENVDRLFEKFQTKHNKKYYNTFERQMRFQIFKRNMIKINQLNKMELGTGKYGITEFTDMTSTEFKMRTGFLKEINENENEIGKTIGEIPNFKLPKEFDWRKKGVITKVKNQGNCGSCWAFSVIGNIEGLHAIKTGNLEEYSEQELVDCDTVDKGCGGGLFDSAFKAIESIGGLELESEYPYHAHQEKCVFNKSLSHIQIKGSIDLPKNETAMALWLIANGPISIGINANAMQFYRGGISHPWWPLCRSGGVDHGVVIVGFGVADYPLFKKTLPYWIVKNSWGPEWGEKGYYRVFRGDNTCGINTFASSAVL